MYYLMNEESMSDKWGYSDPQVLSSKGPVFTNTKKKCQNASLNSYMCDRGKVPLI